MGITTHYQTNADDDTGFCGIRIEKVYLHDIY